jgi:hypothetical protein
LDDPPKPLALAREQFGQRLRITAPKTALKLFHPNAGLSGHARLS